MRTNLPGPGAVEALAGIARRGFLEESGRLWRRYGDTIQLRLGTGPMVLAIHPDGVRDVLLTNRTSFDKLQSYRGVRKYLTGDGLVASNGELWRRQRKLMAPLFTPRAIQAYSGLMLAEGGSLEARWAGLAASGARVEMGEEMMEITAAIILRSLFSMRADEDVRRLKRYVETMIAYVARRMGPNLPDWVPTRERREYLRARAEVHTYIHALIARRRAEPDAASDLLARLMEARDDDGLPMSESLLRDESITMFFAGHETTARTLTATWLVLAAHPDAAARLHAELDEELGDRPVTPDDLHRLPYTLAVVKEVQRLYPAVPFYARDAVVDTEVDGYPIPAGTSVMLSPYWTHRHPDFWPDPERFDPERFMPGAQLSHPQAYHPFATGERVCIGNHFSLLESHLLLAVLARRFAPAMAGPEPRWAMEGVLTPVGGIPMVVRERATRPAAAPA